MIGGFLGGLANAGGVVRGADQAQDDALKRALYALSLQQGQQEQQALGSIYGGALNLTPQGGAAGGIPGGLPQGMPSYQPGQVASQPLPSPRGAPQQAGLGIDTDLDGQSAAPQPFAGGSGGMTSGLPRANVGMQTGTDPLAALKKQVLGLEGNRDEVGSYGEIGPGQIMPETGRQYGYSPDQLWGDSGRAASGKIVDDLYRRSGNDPAAALVGYNRGPGAMSKFQAAGDDVAAVPNLAPPYRQAVQQMLQQTGTAAVKGGVPPPVVRESMGIAGAAASGIDPATFGRSRIHDIAQAIEKATPDAPVAVKALAMMQLHKLMAPEDQQMLRYLMAQQKNELQAELKGLGIQMQQQNLAERERHDRAMEGRPGAGQFFQAEGKTYRADSRTGQVSEVDLPKGAGKVGQAQSGAAGDVDTVAEGIAKYQLPLPSGFALRGPWGQQVLKRVREINPDYDATKYTAKAGGVRAFGYGRQADSVRFVNVAIDHLGTLDDLATALQNGDTRRLNQLQQFLKQEFGHEGPVDFNAAKLIVGDEVAKAVIGGVGSVADRSGLQEQLNRSNSPEQLKGVIDTYKRLMAGQLGGLRREFRVATGLTDQDFDDRLSPDAKRELGRYAAATPPPQGASHGPPYKAGDTVTIEGKQYRVTGGDPNDPDIEAVK